MPLGQVWASRAVTFDRGTDGTLAVGGSAVRGAEAVRSRTVGALVSSAPARGWSGARATSSPVAVGASPSRQADRSRTSTVVFDLEIVATWIAADVKLAGSWVTAATLDGAVELHSTASAVWGVSDRADGLRRAPSGLAGERDVLVAAEGEF